jgi:hypothetical protein
MKHIVLFYGVGSWAAARRVVATHPLTSPTLLFCDSGTSAADQYRFLLEASAQILRRQGHPLMDGLIARAAATPATSEMSRRLTWLAQLRSEAAVAIPGLVWTLAPSLTRSGVADALIAAKAPKTFRRHIRAAINDWLVANCDPLSTLIYVGIDSTEDERFQKIRRTRARWMYVAPLRVAPALTTLDARMELIQAGVRPPAI